MKNLMNRAGLLAAASALALAIALALNFAAQTPAAAQIPAPTQTPEATPTPTATPTSETGANPSVIGSDTDGNGLIEITTPAQLNAIRWDLDGDGNQVGDGDADASVSSDDRLKYFSLLRCSQDTTPAAVPPPSTCVGYELMNDISLASYKNTWTPIGPHWQAVFNGNGFSVTGLEGQYGLFGEIGFRRNPAVNAKTVVKNVDVVGAKITLGANQGGGVLARGNFATIIGCYVTGEITGSATEGGIVDAGGLVAANRGGTIAASVADVNIKITSIIYRARVGGFVGINTGDIHRSYAYGNVIDARTTLARGALGPRSFDGFGFAVNHSINEGTIDSSLSYGNKIVTAGDGKDAAILENSLANFAKGSANNGITLITNSCALPAESQFTCPTTTPTPTSTPTSTPTPTPTPTPTQTPTPTPTA